MNRVFSGQHDEHAALEAEIRGLEAMEQQTILSLKAMKSRKVIAAQVMPDEV
jgi:hypothetical protein